MNTKLWRAGLLSVALGIAGVPAALAQTCPTPCPQPCPVSCPAPCPEKPCCPIQRAASPCVPIRTCPVREAPRTTINNINSNTSCCLSGGVSQSNISGWNVRHKTLTLHPGQGQFSIDNLGPWNTLVLNLINPTDEPLVFETTQRLGKEQSWVIPAHSERTVSYTYTNFFSDEVKFLVYQEPGYAMAHGGCCPTQRTAEAAPVIQPQQPAPQTTFVVPVEPPKSRSTIRGFW
ncbi:MAG TPA: hypothetical protein V6C99_03960 [Oculatellaceae cyanobacterium]|jgi:hypothetical protein